MEPLYTLGTVVKLKDGPSEYTVIGYCPQDQKSQKIYTYLGVNASFGLSLNGNVMPFYQEDVEKVIYLGYSDEESESFRIRLAKLLADKNSNGE